MKYKTAKKNIVVFVQGAPSGYKIGEAKETFKTVLKGRLTGLNGLELHFKKGEVYRAKFDKYALRLSWETDGEAGIFFGFTDKEEDTAELASLFKDTIVVTRPLTEKEGSLIV